MGISKEYQDIIKNEVNVILHSAATVRFDEHLRKAVSINVFGLQSMLKLANETKNLKSFVFISTAYSNCAGRKLVDETVYKPPITADQIIQLVNALDDDYIGKITLPLLNEFPNTYTFTKCIAESEILTLGKGLPIGIIRPSMVVATDLEPLPGWINNIYGPTGVTAATVLGLMRVIHVNSDQIADIVPGDYVSNAVLACAWDIHNKWKEHDVNNCNTIDNNGFYPERESFPPPIYNYVSSNTNPLTWMEYYKYNKLHSKRFPFEKAIYPAMLTMIKNKYCYAISCFLVHTLPAHIVDSVTKLVGKTPKLVDAYKKLHMFTAVITYFALGSWDFRETNTRALLGKMSQSDMSLYRFDISELNWKKYFENHIMGIRLHIVGESLDNISKAIKHSNKLLMIHYTLLTVLATLFVLIIYVLYSLCFA